MYRKLALSAALALLATTGYLGYKYLGYKHSSQEENAAAQSIKTDPTAQNTQSDSQQVYAELDIVYGDLEAPTRIIEYTSLNCGHCAHFHATVFPELKRKYIDTGAAVLIVKHFPLDAQALDAASLLASFPKFRQTKLIDELFAHQAEWMGDNHMDKLSELCNLSKDECAKLASDQKVSNAILDQQLNAQKKFKVSATPTFVINGHIIPYAPTLEEIEGYIGKTSRAKE
ncbi:MAG: thioredoxin domain-containing protein [Candidatus Nucleicultricaceae bacterium]